MRNRALCAATTVAAAAAIALLACAHDVSGPGAETASEQGDSLPANLVLAAENHNVCSVVVWDHTTPEQPTFLKLRDTLPQVADNVVSQSPVSDPADRPGVLGHYRYARWSKESQHQKLLDAVCVVSLTKAAVANASRFFSDWKGPTADQLRLAGASAGVRFSWASGWVSCLYDPNWDDITCEGNVYCWNSAMYSRSSTDAPRFLRKNGVVTSYAGPQFDTYECDNGCYIIDFAGYTCGGGGGTTDFGGGNGGGSVTVNCAPLTVDRGQSVSCSASGGQNYSFTFQGGGYTIPRDPADVSSGWSGEMAVTGNITASSVIGGSTVTSAPVTVTVRARNWSASQPIFDTPYDAGNPFTPYPDTSSKLSHTDLYTVGVSGLTEEILLGPNKGIHYFTSMYHQTYPIELNTTALSAGSAFANHQQGPYPACSPSDIVPAYLNFVKAHEGFAYESNSHTYLHRRAMLAMNVGPVIEAIAVNYDPLPADVTVRLSSQMNAAYDSSAVIDNPAAPGPCNVKWFTP